MKTQLTRETCRAIGAVMIVGLFGLTGCGAITGSSGAASGTSSGTSGTTGSSLSIAGVQVTVQVPLQASLSQKLMQMAGVKTKGLTEAADSGVPCFAEDLSGKDIGTAGTTDSEGHYNPKLTDAQIEAGYVIVAETDSGTMRTYGVHTSAELDAAEVAGTPIAEPLNTETDAVYAVIKSSCDDDLATCHDTIDIGCLKETGQAVMGDDAASTSDLGGYCEGMLQAHAAAIVDFKAGGQDSSTLMQQAMEGDATNLATLVGTSVESVPVADAAKNCAAMMTQMKDAYCKRPAVGEPAPWGDYKSAAGTAGITFDPKAVAAIFKGFTLGEIGNMESEDFRGYATALPQLEGGYATMGKNEEARRSVVEQFKNGSFRDPKKAGPALGFLASTFPACAKTGDCTTTSFAGFDPAVASLAANTGFLEYIDGMGTGATTYPTPGEIFTKFNSTLSDANTRSSWALGGKSACADFIGGFVSYGPTNFKPADYVGTLKLPPGSACSSATTNCIPSAPCTNGLCTSLSTKEGAECLVATDCGDDGDLTCVGAFYTGGKGRCISAGGVPTGASVYTTAGTGPLAYGAIGGYTGPAAGASGSTCSMTRPCDGGISCSSITAIDGVCLPASHKKGPYSACATNSECDSDTCSAGICTLSAALVTAANTGTSTSTTSTIAAIANKLVGQSCAAASECQTYLCQAGLCAATPTTLTAAVETVGLKTVGTACATSAECAVGFFCGGAPLVCTITPTPTTATTPATLPAGSPCSVHANCTSNYCMYTTGMCM